MSRTSQVFEESETVTLTTNHTHPGRRLYSDTREKSCAEKNPCFQTFMFKRKQEMQFKSKWSQWAPFTVRNHHKRERRVPTFENLIIQFIRLIITIIRLFFAVAFQLFDQPVALGTIHLVLNPLSLFKKIFDDLRTCLHFWLEKVRFRVFWRWDSF